MCTEIDAKANSDRESEVVPTGASGELLTDLQDVCSTVFDAGNDVCGTG